MSTTIHAEVTRGDNVESRHCGAYAISDAGGRIILSGGNITSPVFPRSAIKAFQAIPALENGAIERFNFTPAEIALMCASHNGETMHTQTAHAMLAKIGLDETAYECGAHPPFHSETAASLIRQNMPPQAVHNNCSGKHAGMLALALQLKCDPHGYIDPNHLVQQTITRTIGEMCDYDMSQAAYGIDGCSVPSWAIPLQNISHGFARFATSTDLTTARAIACQHILNAVRLHPEMVAGSGRFCSNIMQAVPRVFVKTGAEGVFCAAIPHAGLGIALKCLDGATRAAETMIATVLCQLDCWTTEELDALTAFTTVKLENARKKHIGDVRGRYGLN